MSVAAPERVVVTGAGGFIGRHVVRQLGEMGVETVGWTRADVDLCDRAAVARAMAQARPDAILHLAAAGVAAAQAHQAGLIAAEVAMTEAILAAAPAGCRIVIAGSMSEYGAAGRLAEGDTCRPTTAYGIAKLASGLYAAAYGPGRGLVVRVARLFGVYGPGEAAARFFPALVEGLRAGHPVALSDGLQRRDFIHVGDAAAMLIALASLPAEDGRAALVNVGTGQAVQVRAVALWLAEWMGASPDLLHFGARTRSPGDADLLEADVTLLTELVGAVPPQRLLRTDPAGLF